MEPQSPLDQQMAATAKELTEFYTELTDRIDHMLFLARLIGGTLPPGPMIDHQYRIYTRHFIVKAGATLKRIREERKKHG